MKIAVIGAGPAGLYAALLLRLQHPHVQVEVFERNRARQTYGWGVVFSGRALQFLQAATPQLYSKLSQELESWNELHIVHRDETVAIDGSPFAAIARLTLLRQLQEAASTAGATLHFAHNIEHCPNANEFDLVIGADGIGSTVRSSHEKNAAFAATTALCSNRYIWYGTSQLFDALSLIFADTEHGAFVAHTYRYSDSMSTFIVECDHATFARAQLEHMSPEAAQAFCEDIFATALAGHALQSNQSRWLQFPVVKCAKWVHENIVLLGDACRTVHFSIGSGTRSAMEDSIALVEALRDWLTNHDSDLSVALQSYQRARRHSASRIDDLAAASLDWYEQFAGKLHMTPIELAMDYMRRGSRLDLERLRQHAPKFIAIYERSL